MNKELLGQPKREYKDNLFRMIFNSKEALLKLYNAVSHTDYDNPEELEIVTLENAIYANMKNDLAFVMDFKLNLYEHQSTFNPNMPLRNLFYVAHEYQKFVENKSLYLPTVVKIPTPKFLVFYNGIQKQPERQILKLSDAYQTFTEMPELELQVTMLNINIGNNEELLEQCRLLKEYSLYVERVRNYAGTMELGEAVERAVTECMEEGILKEFLSRYRAEAISVSIFEYNEEREKALLRKSEFEAGIERGIEQGMEQGKRDMIVKMKQSGMSPEEIARIAEMPVEEIENIVVGLLQA